MLKIRVARIFNTYGPNMHPNDGRVISNFIMQALQNEPITIYGDGRQTRSFCYVEDLVDGLVRLMNLGGGCAEPVNLGNPSERTIREIADRIIYLTGSKSSIVHRSLPEDDPKQRCPDISKAQHILQWKPKIALDDGLKRTIAYFDKLIAREEVPLGEPKIRAVS